MIMDPVATASQNSYLAPCLLSLIFQAAVSKPILACPIHSHSAILKVFRLLIIAEVTYRVQVATITLPSQVDDC
jgi:putative Ca2+/H+ antiporter (TMEM165/GDT1 family)